jgi:hypothetical protein
MRKRKGREKWREGGRRKGGEREEKRIMGPEG